MMFRSRMLFLLPSVLLALACMVSTSHATQILFTGGAVAPTAGADGAFLTFLQNRFGAANVQYSRVNEVNAGNLAGFGVDVLILSSTPSSGNIRNKFQNNAIGIVNWEEAVVDCAAGEFCMSLGRPKDNVNTPHTVELTAAGHPIQGALPNGQITWADNPGGNVEVFWTENNGAGVGEIGHETGSARSFLTYADVGDLLTNGSPAPGRRVTLNMTDATFNFVSAEGQDLIENAITWAAVPEPSSLVLMVIGLCAATTRRRRKA